MSELVTWEQLEMFALEEIAEDEETTGDDDDDN